MMRNNKLTFYHQRFTSYERFVTAVIGWDIDFRQMDSGEFNAEVMQLENKEVLLSHGSFGRKMEQKGEAPPGTWTFAFLEPSSPEIIWRGQKVNDQMMMVYPPSAEIDASSPVGFNVLTVSIPVKVFEGLEELYHIDTGRKIQPLCMVTLVNPKKLTEIRQTAHQVISAVHSNGTFVDSDVQSLPHLIVNALSSVKTLIPKPAVEKRSRVVRTLTAYIDAHLKRPISLAEMCVAAGVSPRTIQYAFLERLGVTPQKYIKARRLNGVHRDLCKREPGRGVISDVANDWGFWHMGQLAADYRQLFGKLPTEMFARFKNNNRSSHSE